MRKDGDGKKTLDGGPLLALVSMSKYRNWLEQSYARYNPGSGTVNDVVASLVSAATTSLNVTVGENPAAYSGFNTYLPGYVSAITYNTGEPKAYLNYIFFDASYGNPQFGYQVIPASAATKWEKLSISITAPYTGYAFIYLTNESNYNVFFDDFLIVHEKTTSSLRVTESTDFYPFGLVIEGTRYIDESRLVNSYGYQGMYSEFDARTGWNRFELRGNYDSRIGRWQSADPYTQFASPYLGMGNSGITGIDPDGGFSFVGAFLGAGLGLGISYARNDQEHWYYYVVGGFIAGGILGELAHSSVGTETRSSNAWDRFTARFGEGKTFGQGALVYRRLPPGEWSTVARLDIKFVAQKGKNEWCVYACGEAVDKWVGGTRTKEDFARGENNGQAMDKGTQTVGQWKDFWERNFPYPQFRGGTLNRNNSPSRADIASGMRHDGQDRVYSVVIEGTQVGYQHNVLVRRIQKNLRTGKYRYELMDPNGIRFVSEKTLRSIHRRHAIIGK